MRNVATIFVSGSVLGKDVQSHWHGFPNADIPSKLASNLWQNRPYVLRAIRHRTSSPWQPCGANYPQAAVCLCQRIGAQKRYKWQKCLQYRDREAWNKIDHASCPKSNDAAASERNQVSRTGSMVAFERHPLHHRDFQGCQPPNGRVTNILKLKLVVKPTNHVEHNKEK